MEDRVEKSQLTTLLKSIYDILQIAITIGGRQGADFAHRNFAISTDPNTYRISTSEQDLKISTENN